MCAPTRDRAEAALAALVETLEGLKLKLSESKTRIVGVAPGEQGYDFGVPSPDGALTPSSRCPVSGMLAEWQGDEPGTLGHQRDDWPAPPSPPHRAAGFQLNQFLRGWRQYYRYRNSSRYFAKLDRYVKERMALLLSKRHRRRGRGYGLKLIIGSSLPG